MTKPAKVGGYVQISRKRYKVVARSGHTLDGLTFIEIEDADGNAHTAATEDWRGYCGPWRIIKCHSR